MPPLTNNSPLAVRQQMDDNNHDMVNMITQQIGTMFNPLIKNTNHNYKQLAHQMVSPIQPVPNSQVQQQVAPPTSRTT